MQLKRWKIWDSNLGSSDSKATFCFLKSCRYVTCLGYNELQGTDVFFLSRGKIKEKKEENPASKHRAEELWLPLQLELCTQ